MKKFTLFFVACITCLLMLNVGKLQAQDISGSFTDPIFLGVIRTEIGILSGSFEASDVNAITELDVHGLGITTLAGIEHLTALLKLQCYDNSITNLQDILPMTLEYLDCHNNPVALGDLPGALEYLDCSNTNTGGFAGLPSGLVYLDCSDNTIIGGFGGFPATLEHLNCSGNNIAGFPDFPGGLKYLDCSNNPVTALALPGGLIHLDCHNNPVALGDLPGALEYLDCSNSGTGGFSIFPGGLKYLSCSGNGIGGFPELPGTLEYFDCSNNTIPGLPGLPGPLTTLNCSNNSLTSLPTLTNLTYLDCSNNQLPGLPTLPGTLEHFDCSNNLLPGLPWMIELPLTYFDCSNNQLRALHALPATLTYLDCSGNILSGENLMIGYEEPAGTWNPTGLPAGLTHLGCADNYLTGLDVTGLTLYYLNCSNNYMTDETKVEGFGGAFDGTNYIFVPQNTLPSIVDVINATGCLHAELAGDIIIVTGECYDVTEQLELDIPDGITVKWYATYSGVDGALPGLVRLVNGVNHGTFIMEAGLIESFGAYYALQGGVNIIVNGGTIRAHESVAIFNTINYTNYAHTITITGGVIETLSSTHPAINTGGKIYMTGGLVLGKEGGAVKFTPASGTDDMIYLSGGCVFAYSKAINAAAMQAIMDKRAITEPGMGVAWSGYDGTLCYTMGTSTDLTTSPASTPPATAIWAKHGEINGIDYECGTTHGFIPLDVAVAGLDVTVDDYPTTIGCQIECFSATTFVEDCGGSSVEGTKVYGTITLDDPLVADLIKVTAWGTYEEYMDPMDFGTVLVFGEHCGMAYFEDHNVGFSLTNKNTSYFCIENLRETTVNVDFTATIRIYEVENSDPLAEIVLPIATILATPTLALSYEGGTPIEDEDEIEMCQNDVITLTFTGTPPFVVNYTVNSNDPMTEIGLPSPVTTNNYTLDIPAGSDGTYIFDFVSFTGNGCDGIAIEKFTAIVNPTPTLTLSYNDVEIIDGGTVNMCQGETIDFLFTGTPEFELSYTLTWNDYPVDPVTDFGLDNPIIVDGYTHSIIAGAPGTFVFTFESFEDADNLCPGSTIQQFTAVVAPAPTLLLTYKDDQIFEGDTVYMCQGEFIKLEVPNPAFPGYTGTTPYTILYKVNGHEPSYYGLEDPIEFSTSEHTIMAGAPGEFVFTLESFTDAGSACDGFTIHEFTAIVAPTPTLTLSYKDDDIADGATVNMCQNEVITLTFTGTPPFIVNYTVNSSDPMTEIGLPSPVTTNEYTLDIPAGSNGTYIFDFVSFTGNGCDGTAIDQFTAVVKPLPTVTETDYPTGDLSCGEVYEFDLSTVAGCYVNTAVNAEISLINVTGGTMTDLNNTLEVKFWNKDGAGNIITGPDYSGTFDFSSGVAYLHSSSFAFGDRTTYFSIENLGLATANIEFEVYVKIYDVTDATKAALANITLGSSTALKGPSLSFNTTVLDAFPSAIACFNTYDFAVKTDAGCYDGTSTRVLAEIKVVDPSAYNYFTLLFWENATQYANQTTYPGIEMPIRPDGIAIFGPEPGFVLTDETSYFRIIHNAQPATDTDLEFTISLYHVEDLEDGNWNGYIYDDGYFDVTPLATLSREAVIMTGPTLTAENITVVEGIESVNDTITTGLTTDLYCSDLTAVIEIDGCPGLTNVTHTMLGTLAFTCTAGVESITINDFTYTDIPLVLSTLTATNVGEYPYTITLYKGAVKLVEADALLKVKPILTLHAEDITVTANVEEPNVTVTNGLTPGAYYENLTAVVEIEGNPLITNVTHPILITIPFLYNSVTDKTIATIPNFVYTDIPLELTTLQAANPGVYNYTITIYDYDGFELVKSNVAILTVKHILKIEALDIHLIVNKEETEVTVISGLTSGAYYDGLTAIVKIACCPGLINVTHDILGELEFECNDGVETVTINDFTYTDIDLELSTITATKIGTYTYIVMLYDGTDLLAVSNVAHLYVSCPIEVVDEINGDTYNVVELAGHCWFADNFTGTQYQDESSIPFANPYYHELYPDVALNQSNFGLLYNYESAFPTTTTICPEGWALPTVEQWKLLNMYNAKDLKHHDYWLTPNENTNTELFNSRGAGFYNSVTGKYENLYGYTAYWALNEDGTVGAVSSAAMLTYYCDVIEIVDIKKADALSIRCIMEGEPGNCDNPIVEPPIIEPPVEKSVNVGVQAGTFKVGENPERPLFYNVTTTNIDLTESGTIIWYNASNAVVAAPDFVTSTSLTDGDLPRVLTFTGDYTQFVAGTYYFTLTIDETVSNKQTLVVEPAATPPAPEFVLINGVKWAISNLDVGGGFCTNPEDYGALYQWGRATDGHEDRTSVTIPTLSIIDNPGHNNFIIATANPCDWRNPKNDLLWNSGINDPCPIGWHVPTRTELNSLGATAVTHEWVVDYLGSGINGRLFTDNDSGSSIFLSAGGSREIAGNIPDSQIGTIGSYWSSTPNGINAIHFWFTNSSYQERTTGWRAGGGSIRCVLDE